MSFGQSDRQFIIGTPKGSFVSEVIGRYLLRLFPKLEMWPAAGFVDFGLS